MKKIMAPILASFSALSLVACSHKELQKKSEDIETSSNQLDTSISSDTVTTQNFRNNAKQSAQTSEKKSNDNTQTDSKNNQSIDTKKETTQSNHINNKDKEKSSIYIDMCDGNYEYVKYKNFDDVILQNTETQSSVLSFMYYKNKSAQQKIDEDNYRITLGKDSPEFKKVENATYRRC